MNAWIHVYSSYNTIDSDIPSMPVPKNLYTECNNRIYVASIVDIRLIEQVFGLFKKRYRIATSPPPPRIVTTYNLSIFEVDATHLSSTLNKLQLVSRIES